MRVLFLNHPEADFGEYFLWHGLHEIGCTVVDYPYKPSYHGQVHIYPSCYPTDPGSTPWQRWEAGESGTPMGCTSPYEFAVARPGREYGEAEIADEIAAGRFDLTVVGSPRERAVLALERLTARGLTLPRLVLHDGEDYSALDIAVRQASQYGVRLLLKRELLPGVAESASAGLRVLPFPFSAAIDRDPLPRAMDVCCPLGATHPVRVLVQQVVASMPGLRLDAERRSWCGYIDALRQAKIAPAPRGFGYDTVRRWEAPAVGTFLLAEKLPLVEEFPLVDGRDCATFEQPEQVPGLLRYWLNHDAERERVAANGRAFVRERNSNAARACRMLQVVAEVYG